MPEIETISIEDTAKILHKSPQWVRMGLQQERLKFGTAVQMPTGHWSYNIIKSKLFEYAGIKEEKTNENC